LRQVKLWNNSLIAKYFSYYSLTVSLLVYISV